MADLDVPALLAQGCGQHLGHRHRTVPAAVAAERDPTPSLSARRARVITFSVFGSLAIYSCTFGSSPLLSRSVRSLCGLRIARTSKTSSASGVGKSVLYPKLMNVAFMSSLH